MYTSEIKAVKKYKSDCLPRSVTESTNVTKSQTYLKVHLTSDIFIRLNQCACFLDYICEKSSIFCVLLNLRIIWPSTE